MVIGILSSMLHMHINPHLHIIRHLLNGAPMHNMSPRYRGFEGSILGIGIVNSYDIYGHLKRGKEEKSFKVDGLHIHS